MNIGKAKLERTNKKIIYKLNDLCFGMHGHLTALLKDLHYFFYFKKQGKNKTSDLYLKCLYFQLKHIIVLTRLIENLGGYNKVYEYKRNQVEHFRLNNNRKIVEKVAILDSLASQILLLDNYKKIKSIIQDEKVKSIIEKEIEEINSVIDLLKEKLKKQWEKPLKITI